MGFLDTIAGRNENGRMSKPFVPEEDTKEEPIANTIPTVPTDSDNVSLEKRDEREVERNPDTINTKAEAGLQKAEAAALVYGPNTVLAIYAW